MTVVFVLNFATFMMPQGYFENVVLDEVIMVRYIMGSFP